MSGEAFAQDIEVGAIRVDTGDAWLDLLMFLVVLTAVVGAMIVYKRWG